jgi:hypothetical protein
MASLSFRDSIFSPAKKAAGSFDNKNCLTKKLLLTRLLKFRKVIVHDYLLWLVATAYMVL